MGWSKSHSARLTLGAEPLRTTLESLLFHMDEWSRGAMEVYNEDGKGKGEEKGKGKGTGKGKGKVKREGLCKYYAKVQALKLEDADPFAHVAEPMHIKVMSEVLPGWGASSRRRQVLVGMLQRAPELGLC